MIEKYTKQQQELIIPLITLMEHCGATESLIITILTREVQNCKPLDVRLLLNTLLEDKIIIIDHEIRLHDQMYKTPDNVYRLNWKDKNKQLFKEALHGSKRKN